MDPILQSKIEVIVSELQNEADKTIHDPSNVYALMHNAVNIFKITLTHIGYLEQKMDNLQAENSRLNGVAKY